MNVLRTIFTHARSTRIFFASLLAAALMAGLLASATLAGMKPVSTHGLGAALALIAQVRTLHSQVNGVSGASADSPVSNTRHLMQSRAILKARATANVPVPISSAVQTYDVFNPAPGFRPLIGFQGPNDANGNPTVNNSASNPPFYINSLTPVNLTPVWSRDETFIVFSSNRTAAGGVQARFHLWEISVNGGQAFQITDSQGADPNGTALPNNGGEFFPALSSANDALTFTSDAQSAGSQNLYVIASPGFSYNAVASLGNSKPFMNIADPTQIGSPTLRASTQAGSTALTGFDQVQRPTFSPNQNQLIVFSAHSTSGTYAGHYHIYFLYTDSLGFNQNNQTSYPGKLTDGPADDTDPTYSPDNQFIAFSSTANAITRQPNGSNSFGPNPPNLIQDPNQSQSITSVTQGNTNRSIFLLSGGSSGNGNAFGTVPTQLQSVNGRVTLAGNDDYGPAWSNFSNQNQYTNTSGNFGYLAFARKTATAATHEIYYLQVLTGLSSPSTETVKSETASGGANVAVQLNTDDPNGAFDHSYPSWSPFVSIFSLTYASNRTVTYNDPATSFPTESAVSVEGSHVNGVDANSGYDVATNYQGLLISQLLNLDPPTLLRFSPNEVVHVQAAGATDANGNSVDPVGGSPNKLAASGGQQITLTVRLSDREANIDNTGGPNGGPRVYVQIKNPNSKYQDAQTTEHKVFARDAQFNGQSNQEPNDTNSGTANIFLGNHIGGIPAGYGATSGIFADFELQYTYPSYPTPQNNLPVFHDLTRGAHGGHWLFPNTDNPFDTYIYVGKTPQVSGTNPNGFSGGDPGLFIPQGPEYECQVVNPQFASSGNQNAPGNTTPFSHPVTMSNQPGTPPVFAGPPVVGDFIDPFWLAGVDDQGAFSGGVYTGNTDASKLKLNRQNQTLTDGVNQTDRPTANYTSQTTGLAMPAEWLQMKLVPSTATPDHSGGVLYTVTWTTPTSGSDFYVDVIAYDKAAFPNLPAGTSSYAGLKTNWRIYDNVGGFSTNQSIGNDDILVVSDYALGQKFAATTFGGRNSNLNLVPVLFGAESYYTDIDVNLLPDTIYAGRPNPITSYLFFPALQNFDTFAENGLGVGSYVDNQISDKTFRDFRSNFASQRYSIWRILSRGPVPQSVLKSYLPTPVSQPAIQDPADPTYQGIPAAKVLDARRCVVWLSPFTGDVLSDPGAIDDPGTVGQPGVSSPRQSTTSILTNFVQSGGRLFVSGQDVGSTLTLGGSINNTTTKTVSNFLPDVLNATLASTGTATRVLAGAGTDRISGNPQYDKIYGGESNSYVTLTGGLPGPFTVQGGNFPYQDNLVIGDPDFSDSGLTQIPPFTLPVFVPAGTNNPGQQGANLQGQPDTIIPVNNAVSSLTYGAGGAAALIYHEDPYGIVGTGGTAGQLPNGGTGSRVVYAAFGLEALSQDFYSSDCPHPAMTPVDLHVLIPDVVPRSPRSEILHNIVDYLRTGIVSGLIQYNTGTVQGVLPLDGATVYLRPLSGNAPSTRAAFSATSASGGKFTIFGVEPGTYTLVAYKAGFSRAASNTGVTFTVEGDVTKTGATLTLNPLPPGTIAGAVKDTSGNLINGSAVTFTSQDGSTTKTITTINGSVAGSTTENYLLQNVAVTNYTAVAASPLNEHNLPEYTTAAAPDAPFNTNIAVTSSTTTQPVNFTETPIAATVSGQALDPNGTPIVGAVITVTDSKGNPINGLVSGKPITATTVAASPASGSTPAVAAGTYTLTDLPATPAPTKTTYTLTATKVGFTAGTATPGVELGDQLTGVNITLTPIPVGIINGTVTDSVTKAVVPGAVVTFVSADGSVTLTATAGADGIYTIGSVPPGTYNATVAGPKNPNGNPASSSGAAQSVAVASAPPNTTANFTVTTTPLTISGKVTDNAATPNPLAKVLITVTDNSATAAKGTVIATTQTDAGGNYSITLPPGQYTATLTASLVGFATQTVPTSPFATIYTGDVVSQNFALVPAAKGSISGQVFDATTGGPVVGAVVTFVSTDGTTTLTSQPTNASGAYFIPPDSSLADPSGNYTGTAATPINTNKNPEYASPSAVLNVTIPPGGAKTGANFTLTEIPASISGTVTDAQTGKPIAGASVALTDSSGKTVGTPTTTGTNGNYSFSPVPASQNAVSYTLVATVPGGGYFSGSIATTPASIFLGDQLTAQIITLNEQGIVYGLATDNSALLTTPLPLSNVVITIKDTSTGGVVTTTPTPLTTGAVTNGPDGKPENYQATYTVTPGHTYSITAAKANYDASKSASISPTNGVPARADLQLTSSIGLLGGLVNDSVTSAAVGGATVTVTSGSGTTATVVATFSTSGSASTAPDAKPENYQGQITEGTYTVTLTKGSRAPVVLTSVVIGGGKFTRLDFTSSNALPAVHTFPQGLQFVSTPYDYSALGFDVVFGTLNTAATGTMPNGNRSNVAVWNPTVAAYALDPNAPADTLRLGVGYWVYLRAATPVTQQGASPTTPYVPISLHPSWNQIGVPNPSTDGNGNYLDVSVGSLKFDNGQGGMISFAQASSTQYHLVSPTLYSYDGTSYQPVSSTGVLSPWKAYWIKVYANATLEFPTQLAPKGP